MTAKVIPFVGETYTGDNPAVLKVLHVTFGASTTSPDVEITASTTATENIVVSNVPAGSIITQCWTQIEEAFYAGCKLNIGDTATANLFASSVLGCTTTTATLISTFTDTAMNVPVTDSKIVVNQSAWADTGAHNASCGLLHIYVQYTVMND